MNRLENAHLESLFLEALEMIENNYVLNRKAFDLLKEAAQGGYVPAQKKLGSLYSGYTIAESRIENYTPRTQNWQESAFYYQMAAQSRDAEACYNLAGYYLEGRLGEVEPEKAIHFLKLALEADSKDNYCALAATRLGEIYLRGFYERGQAEDGSEYIQALVPVDPLLASEYLRKGYEWGNPSSGMLLSDLYLAVKDNHHAQQILEHLLESGLEEAQDRLEGMRREGLTDEQSGIVY